MAAKLASATPPTPCHSPSSSPLLSCHSSLPRQGPTEELGLDATPLARRRTAPASARPDHDPRSVVPQPPPLVAHPGTDEGLAPEQWSKEEKPELGAVRRHQPLPLGEPFACLHPSLLRCSTKPQRRTTPTPRVLLLAADPKLSEPGDLAKAIVGSFPPYHL
ncbi:hypothetical protein E2562_001490 [Oryza meyeriana var. granulata]|uniref:Uncharacterized protein n=1 Tax=Oryza meyeriana var. granulata TaxID=110450 RepID=A0A6G1DCU3_9ORYZ|nr:hypothetical protein E2562_001490 [Oryza meyeriana var. granulata]